MYDYRAILKRTGIVLIGLGIFDSAYMLYRISQGQNYSSSLNILALVAGIFLFRANLRAVQIMTWAVAFMMANLIGSFILLPFLQPLGLLAIKFRLDPIGLSTLLLVRVALIALLSWVYIQLRTEPVVSASSRAGYSVSNPKLAFILGAAIALFLTGMIHVARAGEAGAKAVELAHNRYGETYKYHVTGIQWSNGTVKANLTAYNEQEIKPVEVEWER